MSIEHTICISAPQMLSELFSDLPQPNECAFVCVCVCVRVLYVDNSKVHSSLEPKSEYSNNFCLFCFNSTDLPFLNSEAMVLSVHIYFHPSVQVHMNDCVLSYK